MNSKDRDRQADANVDALDHFLKTFIPDEPEPDQTPRAPREGRRAEGTRVQDAPRQPRAQREPPR